jgi:hypothetical protein
MNAPLNPKKHHNRQQKPLSITNNSLGLGYSQLSNDHNSVTDRRVRGPSFRNTTLANIRRGDLLQGDRRNSCIENSLFPEEILSKLLHFALLTSDWSWPHYHPRQRWDIQFISLYNKNVNAVGSSYIVLCYEDRKAHGQRRSRNIEFIFVFE